MPTQSVQVDEGVLVEEGTHRVEHAALVESVGFHPAWQDEIRRRIAEIESGSPRCLYAGTYRPLLDTSLGCGTRCSPFNGGNSHCPGCQSLTPVGDVSGANGGSTQ